MLAVILVRCLGWHVTDIPHGRLTGQWMIATSIGLHFTPVVVEQILGHFALMLSAVFFTLLLALLGVEIMRRRGMDLTTAFFAFMPANFFGNDSVRHQAQGQCQSNRRGPKRAPGVDCSVRSVSDVFHRQRFAGSGPCPFAQRLVLATTAIDRWCADGKGLEALQIA